MIEPDPAPNRSSQRAPGARSGRLPAVLVVDDDAALRDCVRELLEDAFELLDAATGQAALALLRVGRPAAVILDLRLPDMAGLDVLSELRGLHPTLPVIIVTAVASVRTAVEAMKRGATDYMVKPFDTAELVGALEGALAGHHAWVGRGEGVLQKWPTRTVVVSPVAGRSAVLAALLSRYGPVVAAPAPAAVRLNGGHYLGLVVLDRPLADADASWSDLAGRLRGIDITVIEPPRDAVAGRDTRDGRVSLGALFDLARRHLENAPPDTPGLNEGVGRAFEALACSYTSRFTVGALARTASLSESHFAHVFRSETGFTPQHLLRRIRVELTKGLLAEGTWSEREIARAVGFVDRSHLSRAVRAETGLPPRVFRMTPLDARGTTLPQPDTPE